MLYLERGGAKILIDAGKGDVPILDNPGGALLDELKAMCVKPHDITQILLTHAHWDHIGGLFKPGTNFTEKTFERAKVSSLCASGIHIISCHHRRPHTCAFMYTNMHVLPCCMPCLRSKMNECGLQTDCHESRGAISDVFLLEKRFFACLGLMHVAVHGDAIVHSRKETRGA